MSVISITFSCLPLLPGLGLSRESVGHGPSVVEAIPYRLGGDPGVDAPFRERLRDAVERQESIRPRVTHLNCSGRPAAIIWRVRTFVVNAIQRVPHWSLSHIGEEVRELLPTLTHRNTATAVRGIRLVTRVGAPGEHAVPRHEYFAPAHAVGSARCALRSIGAWLTALRYATAEIAGAACVLSSAGASTSPHSVSGRTRHALNHDPFTKRQTGQIDERRHRIKIPLLHSSDNDIRGSAWP